MKNNTSLLCSSFCMFFRHYKQWLVIGISVLLILFLFQKTFSPLIEQRDEISSKIFLVNELQYAILKDISIGVLKNTPTFEVLNNQISALKKTLMSLKNTSAIQQDPALTAKLTQLITSEEQQSLFIEQFKSNYSVLKNSLIFFPTAYKACVQLINSNDEKTTPSQLSQQLKTTLIAGLMTMNNTHSNRILALNQALNKLEKQTLSLECQIFLDHSRILSHYTPKIHALQTQLSALKTDKKIHSFYVQLKQSTSQVMAKNKNYYLIILIFTLFLLIYIGIILGRLFHSNQTLKNTLRTVSGQQVLFEALIKASSAITLSKDKKTLYQNICDIATQESLFDSCWIGEVQSNQTIVPTAYAGEGTKTIKHLVIPIPTHSNDPQKNSSVLNAYLQKKPIITNHYQQKIENTQWANLVQKLGIQGNAALPIIVESKVIAILTVYTHKAGFFTYENNAFLHQLVHDIGITLERFNAEKEKEQHQQDLAISSIAFESHEATLITDANANIIRTNQAFSKLTGYSQQEALGQTPKFLQSKLHTESFYKNLWLCIFKTGSWQGEIWNRKKDGSFYPCWQSISAVLDKKGQITHYISHALDLTKDKETQRQINHLNFHDKLTNLPNRSLLIDRLEQALSQKEPHYHLLFLINLNRFKLFNDSLGHTAGDELLIKVGERLQGIHLDDINNVSIARVGNDEFTVSCAIKTAHASQALQISNTIAQKIQHHLGVRFTIQNQMAMIDTSMGLTLFTPSDKKTPEDLLKEANIALYRAKKIAKQTAQSTIQFYDPSMLQDAQDPLTLENQLRNALRNLEFTLQYQPQIDLKSGNIIGVETLIRWQKQDGTIMLPNDFIPALEKSGLIIPVGLWIIEEAILQAKLLHKTLPNLTISINLSAIQFSDKYLIKNVQKLLIKNQFPPHLLEFEITESLLMSDIEETIHKLNTFTDLGIKIAIDDFGTGYSSLAYLKRFPVNKLKIDKAFIDDITQANSSDAAIVKATIQMAKALNICTIAEGVEEQAQLGLLKEMHCDEIQGYYFSKPLSPDDLMTFINDQK